MSEPPCPFCGGEAVMERRALPLMSTVSCSGECRAWPHITEDTEQLAAATWNRRAPIPTEPRSSDAKLTLDGLLNGVNSANIHPSMLDGPAPTAERESLRSVLVELLRLYDWRFEIAKMERENEVADLLDSDLPHPKLTKLLVQYGREEKVAWEAARRVLDETRSES